MFDATRLLGGLIGGALPGAASKLLRQASRQNNASPLLGGAAVPGGALGLIGGLAVAAYEHYSEQQKAGGAGSAATPPPPPGASATPPPPPARQAATPPPPPGAEVAPPPVPSTGTVAQSEHAMLLIQAMIAAAKADGEVDADESRHILAKLEEAGASDDERAWVMAEMAKPLDVAALVEQAGNPRLALEIYAASLMAIEVDTYAERRYLKTLRDRLCIQTSTAAQIHQALGMPET